jgi:hypothetical protein
MNKLIDTQFRQGDVGLIAVTALPSDATPETADGSRIVLKYGEATGHAHAFSLTPAVQTFITPKKERYLRLVEPMTLKHEEHTHIEIPPGVYAIPNQVEWSDEQEPRIVAD